MTGIASVEYSGRNIKKVLLAKLHSCLDLLLYRLFCLICVSNFKQIFQSYFQKSIIKNCRVQKSINLCFHYYVHYFTPKSYDELKLIPTIIVSEC